MFSFLRGEVAEIGLDRVVLDVGGVGYELICSSKTLQNLKVGQQAKLRVHLHLAQDVLGLYGFGSGEEKAMFCRLISVTRVGPKAALGALCALTPTELAAAIVSGDERTLARVPGMGKKTAQRIILELKEKIGTEEAVGAGAQTSFAAPQNGEDMRAEAIAGLIALGYDGNTAKRAVEAVKEPCTKVEQLLTLALKGLSKI
jgi:Holliday junction DNA helicase RuvA